MQRRGVDHGVADRLDVLLALNPASLQLGRHILVGRAMRVGAVAAAQVVLKVHHIAVDVRHSRASHNAQLGTARAAVLVFNRVQHVIEWCDALSQCLGVGASVVGQAVHSSDMLYTGYDFLLAASKASH